MVRRRIGNNIDIEWSVYRDNTPEDFSGKTVEVYLLEKAGKIQKIADSLISISGNTVRFTWLAGNQYSVGTYSIILKEYINGELCNTVDIADAIDLVPNTALEDGDADYVSDSSVTFRSDFDVIFKSIDKAYEAAKNAEQQALIAQSKEAALISTIASATTAYDDLKELLDNEIVISATLGYTVESFFEEDEKGDLRPKPKADGSARGIYTDSFISSGGLNEETGGSEGGIAEVTIKFEDIEPNPEGYKTDDNGVIILPNYPTVEDIDLSKYLSIEVARTTYLTIEDAADSYASKQDVNEFKALFNSMFVKVDDGNGNVSIKALLGLWNDSFISSGGLNDDITSGSVINSLADINDVTITNPADGESLVYDLASGKWVNRLVGGGGGEYLPITGGVLNGNLQIGDDDNTAYRVLSIKRNGVTTYIATTGAGEASFNVTYANGVGHSLLLRSDAALYYNGSDYHTLIHSGNIGSYNAGSADYLSKSYANGDANLAKGDGVKMIYTTASGCNMPIYTSGISVITEYGGWQMASYATPTQVPNPYFRAMDSNGSYTMDWKQLAFLTDNVASADYASRATYSENATRLYANDYYAYGSPNPYYMQMRYNVLGDYSWYLSAYPETPAEVSVDRARKLVTARTIWGQSFDGTGNIVGDFKYSLIHLEGGNEINSKGDDGTGQPLCINWRGAGNVIMVVGGGNVLIGTTADNGAKLQVDGGVIRNVLSLNTNHSNGPIVTQSYNGVNKTWWGYSPHLQGVYLFNQNDNGLFISDNNNVLIGTTIDGGAKLRVEGDCLINGRNFNAISNTSDNLAYYGYDNGGIHGTIKITLPNSWNSDMSMFEIWVYEYNSMAGSKVFVSGYSYSGSHWYNRKYTVLGNYNKGVRLAHDGSKLCILLGNTSSYWEYPQIYLKARSHGLTGREYINSSEYSISLITDESSFSTIQNVDIADTYTNNITAYGNIYASGGITARYTSSSSDAKLKDNIKLLSQEDAINILMALKPSSWNWKDGGELAYGLVAQDVEGVLPCSVTYGEHLSLQYNMFHAFEISVGQNHETRIRQLEEELQTLKREYYGNR